MIWIAIVTSLCALLWLSNNNAKRRRILRLPANKSQVPIWLGWGIVCVPGVALTIASTPNLFVSWMGAVCVFGWMLVSFTPEKLQKLFLLCRDLKPSQT